MALVMTHKSHTTWARLYSAVNDLATRRGNLQNRLYYALVTLSHLKAETFPEELRADFEFLQQELAKARPKEGEDPIEVATRNMDDVKAEKCAKKIVEMFNRIARKYCED